MSKPQLIVLLATILGIAVLCLIPPWKFVYCTREYFSPSGMKVSATRTEHLAGHSLAWQPPLVPIDQVTRESWDAFKRRNEAEWKTLLDKFMAMKEFDARPPTKTSFRGHSRSAWDTKIDAYLLALECSLIALIGTGIIVPLGMFGNRRRPPRPANRGQTAMTSDEKSSSSPSSRTGTLLRILLSILLGIPMLLVLGWILRCLQTGTVLLPAESMPGPRQAEFLAVNAGRGAGALVIPLGLALLFRFVLKSSRAALIVSTCTAFVIGFVSMMGWLYGEWGGTPEARHAARFHPRALLYGVYMAACVLLYWLGIMGIWVIARKPKPEAPESENTRAPTTE